MDKKMMVLLATNGSDLTGDQIASLTGYQIASLTGDQIASLAGDQIARLTGDQIARLTGYQIASLTGYQIASLTGYQIASLTGDQIASLTGYQIASLTGDQIASLTGDQIASLTGDQIAEVPKVERLYSRILGDIKAEQRILSQSTFGPETLPDPETVCDTPMCIAGHTVNLAGKAGYALKSRVGFAFAATLIHRASRPDAPLPRYDTYPNEWAMAFIEARAAEE